MKTLVLSFAALLAMNTVADAQIFHRRVSFVQPACPGGVCPAVPVSAPAAPDAVVSKINWGNLTAFLLKLGKFGCAIAPSLPIPEPYKTDILIACSVINPPAPKSVLPAVVDHEKAIADLKALQQTAEPPKAMPVGPHPPPRVVIGGKLRQLIHKLLHPRG